MELMRIYGTAMDAMDDDILELLQLQQLNNAQFLSLLLLLKELSTTKRKFWMRPMLREREEHGHNASLLRGLQSADREYFIQFLRMPPEILEKLLNMVGPHIDRKVTRCRRPISAKDRLSMTLRFLATGESFRSISYGFRIARSTVCHIVRETCAVIFQQLQAGYLTFPGSEAEWLRIAEGFFQKWQLPHCCGSIDGKHVIMECPILTGSLNHNYKGTFSKVLMADADHQYKFIMVDFGHYGSESDGGIFSKCAFGQQLSNGLLHLPKKSVLPNSNIDFPYFFVGDEAFPLRSNLMRPYPRRMQFSHNQRIYNYRLSRARRVVENAFEILSARFRVYRRSLNFSEITTTNIVMATIVLHNFVLTELPSHYHFDRLDFEDRDHNLRHGAWRREVDNDTGLVAGGRFGSNMYCTDGKVLRDTLASYLVTNGAVDWQFQKVYGAL